MKTEYKIPHYYAFLQEFKIFSIKLQHFFIYHMLFYDKKKIGKPRYSRRKSFKFIRKINWFSQNSI